MKYIPLVGTFFIAVGMLALAISGPFEAKLVAIPIFSAAIFVNGIVFKIAMDGD